MNNMSTLIYTYICHCTSVHVDADKLSMCFGYESGSGDGKVGHH